MPALTATRFAPQLRAFYLHLQARGKCKMVALVAVMRKLLHAIFGMFKHDAAFDGDKLCPALTLATQPPLMCRSPLRYEWALLVDKGEPSMLILGVPVVTKSNHR